MSKPVTKRINNHEFIFFFKFELYYFYFEIDPNYNPFIRHYEQRLL